MDDKLFDYLINVHFYPNIFRSIDVCTTTERDRFPRALLAKRDVRPSGKSVRVRAPRSPGGTILAAEYCRRK